jgi:DNA (cytosine-5)-methyltransferase 1
MSNLFKFIDLFCGIGGFHIALSNLGGKCVFASDIDKQACEVYENNYGVKPSGDITKIHEDEIPSHEILAAGFPCQAFSLNGKQLGFKDSRGTLFFDVARIAKRHKPKIVLLENVANFSKHDDGRTLSVVRKIMEDMGYHFYCSVLNSSFYGVPQSRARTYMVCLLKDGPFKFPSETKSQICLRDILLPAEETSFLEIDPKTVILENEKLMSEEGLFGMESISKPVRIGHINSGRQGERIYADWGHAITFSSHGGGIGAKTGLYIIGGRNGVVRKLHPRECARAMGFPESFKLHKSNAANWRMFGNSVIVPLIQMIAKNAIGTEYETDT